MYTSMLPSSVVEWVVGIMRKDLCRCYCCTLVSFEEAHKVKWKESAHVYFPREETLNKKLFSFERFTDLVSATPERLTRKEPNGDAAVELMPCSGSETWVQS